MHKGFLFFLYKDILWVPLRYEKRVGAYPYGSVKVPEACCVVIGSIEEAAVGLGQETIT